MSSRFLEQRVNRAALAFGLSTCCAFAYAHELRVCSDPDNLPYSNKAERGFENAIARVLADQMGRTLVHVWQPFARGYVGKTLGANACDVLIGVPVDFDRVLATRPYYRSSYVFVSRDAKPIASFDDPRVMRSKVGVQLVGNDLAATPPGYALARHGAVDNVIGFTILGDGPAAERMVDAVARGELGVGVIWGPQAGYFAAQAKPPLTVAIANAPRDLTSMPFEFAIAVGVRKGDRVLRDAIDAALAARRADIDAILAAYSVPRTDR